MPRKPVPKRDDPEQSKRFIETAEEAGATEDALEVTLEKIAKDRDRGRIGPNRRS